MDRLKDLLVISVLLPAIALAVVIEFVCLWLGIL